MPEETVASDLRTRVICVGNEKGGSGKSTVAIHIAIAPCCGLSHYALVVEEARAERQVSGKAAIDWIVLRNRLSTLTSRNKRFIDQALQDLSQRLGFRHVEGLAERVIFREFYPRGLTAVDDLDELVLGTRPTMSHVTAQIEV